jgi:hypothetical protein
MSSRNQRDKNGKASDEARSGHGNHSRSSSPEPPEGWRDLAKTDYDYPSDFDAMGRRERRRAKKDWRREDQGQRTAWLRDRRRAEPVSPLSILVVVVLLGIIILGIGGGLPGVFGNGETKQPVGLLTPADTLPLPTPAGPASPESSSASSAIESTPPPETLKPNPAATASVNEVVGKWARLFYTRKPADQAYTDLVNDASKYMTDDLTANFIVQGDSTYEALKAEKGESNVVSADVVPPKPGSAPADTPGRISRLVTVVIGIAGSKPGRITLPLLVTVVQQDNGWVISDVDGGTGP